MAHHGSQNFDGIALTVMQDYRRDCKFYLAMDPVMLMLRCYLRHRTCSFFFFRDIVHKLCGSLMASDKRKLPYL